MVGGGTEQQRQAVMVRDAVPKTFGASIAPGRGLSATCLIRHIVNAVEYP